MSAASYPNQPNALPQPTVGAGASVTLPGRAARDGGAVTAPSRTQFQQMWDTFKGHRAAYIGLWVLSAMILGCIFLPFVLQDPSAPDMKILAATPPSSAHLLGTDGIGRDVFARLVNAGRISLAIGFVVAIGASFLGAVVGVMAGYFGGRVDAGLMWVVNVLMTIPSLPLLMAMAVLVASPTSAIGPYVKAFPQWMRIAFVMVALGWMGISRVVRSQVISLREQEFVEAARALGGKDTRIMFLHILPNCISVIAVFTTLAVSGAIIGESALSFLGLGVQPPTATWGNMLADGRDLFSILQYWWTVWFPALAIFVTVLSVNFIGDGVRDAMDPKSQKK
ncbi:MAG: ABC transporter permease [Thermoleophilia bacterium]|nr:ABC transporter permease [Thermoleophilia bacterium]